MFSFRDEYAEIQRIQKSYDAKIFNLSLVEQGIFNYLVYRNECRDFVGWKMRKPTDELISMILIDYCITCISLVECKRICCDLFEKLDFHYNQDMMLTFKGQYELIFALYTFKQWVIESTTAS